MFIYKYTCLVLFNLKNCKVQIRGLNKTVPPQENLTPGAKQPSPLRAGRKGAKVPTSTGHSKADFVISSSKSP